MSAPPDSAGPHAGQLMADFHQGRQDQSPDLVEVVTGAQARFVPPNGQGPRLTPSARQMLRLLATGMKD